MTDRQPIDAPPPRVVVARYALEQSLPWSAGDHTEAEVLAAAAAIVAAIDRHDDAQRAITDPYDPLRDLIQYRVEVIVPPALQADPGRRRLGHVVNVPIGYIRDRDVVVDALPAILEAAARDFSRLVTSPSHGRNHPLD